MKSIEKHYALKRITESSQLPMRTCSLCNKSSEIDGMSLIYFGEWMSKKEITVHYYCLLLSTHLPQRGEDHSGILGFFLRDIRIEITKARKRKCKYCFETSATIQCATCQKYFHLTCGHTSKCLSQFVGEFKSYCHACVPVDEFQMEVFARKPPLATELCFICTQIMGNSSKRWIYAKCCGNGYTHSKCMKIYALSAGYYLTCIWCKDKRFREDIKYLGVFVPDRDANWEREKGAYKELYCGHKRCDMEICNCPKGRDYTNISKWQLIICKLCGAFGAHNPVCIPGFEGSKDKLKEFKCDICAVTEQTILHKTISGPPQELIDTTLYVSKDATGEKESTTLSQSLNMIAPSGSVTLQEAHDIDNNNTTPVYNLTTCHPFNKDISTAAYTLTQSSQTSQKLEVQVPDGEILEEDTSDSDDSAYADLLVQKILDTFQVNP